MGLSMLALASKRPMPLCSDGDLPDCSLWAHEWVVSRTLSPGIEACVTHLGARLVLTGCTGCRLHQAPSGGFSWGGLVNSFSAWKGSESDSQKAEERPEPETGMELVLPSCLPPFLPAFLPSWLPGFLPSCTATGHALFWAWRGPSCRPSAVPGGCGDAPVRCPGTDAPWDACSCPAK